MAATWPTRRPANGMQLRDRGDQNGKYEEPGSSEDDFDRRMTPKKTRSNRATLRRKQLTTFLFRTEAGTSKEELAPQRRSSRKRKPSFRTDEIYITEQRVQQDVYDDDDVVGVGADGGGEADDEDEDLEEQDQEEDLENGDDRQHRDQEDGEGLEAREQDDVREEGQEGVVVKEGAADANGGLEENGHAEGKQEEAQPLREGLRSRGVEAEALAGGYTEQDTEEPQEEAGFSGRESGEGEEGEEGEDGEDGEGAEEGEEEDGSEGQEGRRGRRYALRQRTEVQRFSPRRKEQPARLSPQVAANGRNRKRGREGRQRPSSRSGKRRHTLRADDSDNSLLLDEVERGWGGSRIPDGLYVPPGDPSAPAVFAPPASGWANQDPEAGEPVAAGGASAKAGADIQPVAVDLSVDFDQVGGLSNYVDALKEMVFFPLLYPDFFANYHITPPRGVLLCGPPGTGKTLVARALAAAASKAGQKVTFYMRKGADVLSKWVGEAERQLKMLFEEAQRNQPAIIFFDEIDGLAPVRSSKQEQIHNSIVSTLLALMDGLDSRGQVVVIGATNRVDAIDSALRRPGRFDREFTFPLPNADARAEILNIHTRNWAKPPSTPLIEELAATCVGYCGADLKALCTEAAIRAFRHKYPQVYQSDEQYVIDIDSVVVERRHFVEAMAAITPAAHRSAVVHARPLPPLVRPVLNNHLSALLEATKDVFPAFGADPEEDDLLDWEGDSDEETEADLGRLFSAVAGSSVAFVQRPRLLLCGRRGAGQDHLGPALLHELEQFPVHSLGLPSLLSDPSAKTPEEALVHIIGEARRTTPAVLYLPHLPLWWSTADDSLRATLVMLLSDLPPTLPLLLLGTSDLPEEELEPEARGIFGRHIHSISPSTPSDREAFFDPVLRAAATIPRLSRNKKPAPVPELSKAPRQPREPTETELAARAADEEQAQRRLRMCFRDVCNRLLLEKKFADFHYPATEEEYPGYKEVIQRPMDVATLLRGVDGAEYPAKALFLADVDLIAENAKAYFGENPQEARYVSRAFALKDVVYSMLSQLDPSLVKQCDEIAARGGPIAPPPSKFNIASHSRFAPPPVARTSARLRGVQPNVDIHTSPEVRRVRRGSEGAKLEKSGLANGEVADGSDSQAEAGIGAVKVNGVRGEGLESQPEDAGEAMDVESNEPEAAPTEVGGRKGPDVGTSQVGDGQRPAIPGTAEAPGPSGSEKPADGEAEIDEGEPEVKAETKAGYVRHVARIKATLVEKSAQLTVDRLEGINACLCRLVHGHRRSVDRTPLLQALDAFVEDDGNFDDDED